MFLGFPAKQGCRSAVPIQGRGYSRQELGHGPDNPIRVGRASGNIDGSDTRQLSYAFNACGIGVSRGDSSEAGTGADAQCCHGLWRQIEDGLFCGYFTPVLGPEHACVAVKGRGDTPVHRQDETGAVGCIVKGLNRQIAGCAHEVGVKGQINVIDQEIGHVLGSIGTDPVGQRNGATGAVGPVEPDHGRERPIRRRAFCNLPTTVKSSPRTAAEPIQYFKKSLLPIPFMLMSSSKLKKSS